MIVFRYGKFVAACVLLWLAGLSEASGQTFPSPEKLTYLVEWRLVDAGTAVIELLHSGSSQNWDFKVDIQSTGLVSRLYKVEDTYRVSTTGRFCLVSSTLDGLEGKRRFSSSLKVDGVRHKSAYEEKNLTKNQTEKKELDIAPCTFDIAGALATLRTLNLEPGKSTVIPITDGKKFAQARLEALTKEAITVDGKKYSTTRYEAYLFDNVLYKRRGRLLIWVTDDAQHVPVQFRLLMGFPIGTITIGLQKPGK
jgi:hypothetical protein